MHDRPLRRRIWKIVEVAEPGDTPSLIFDVAIRVLIALNVVIVVIETVPEVDASIGAALRLFDLLSVAVFTVEYLLRIWSCTAEPRYAHAVSGRVRFALTPLAIIDLLAILPFWLPGAAPDLRILRGVRLFRLFRILKLVRYSKALRTFGRVFRVKADELLLTLALVGFLVLIASSLLYFAEHDAQPEAFSSIPAALWWGIVTLTTVGYGDIFPVTSAGRLLAGGFALTAILLIALPTAILGAAFVDELAAQRERAAGADPGAGGGTGTRDGLETCPHCGGVLEG